MRVDELSRLAAGLTCTDPSMRSSSRATRRSRAKRSSVSTHCSRSKRRSAVDWPMSVASVRQVPRTLGRRSAPLVPQHLGPALPQVTGRTCDSLRPDRWMALTRYRDDGRLELENNTAKRALRSVARTPLPRCRQRRRASRGDLLAHRHSEADPVDRVIRDALENRDSHPRERAVHRRTPTAPYSATPAHSNNECYLVRSRTAWDMQSAIGVIKNQVRITPRLRSARRSNA